MNEDSASIWRHFDSVRQMFRGEKACPWLSEQTHDSLLPYLTEELGEFMEALRPRLESKTLNLEEPIDELGDIWLQCVLHTILLSERSGKSVREIFDSWRQKIEIRHPHVFDPQENQRKWTRQEVFSAWKERKDAEKKLAKPGVRLPKTASFRELASSLSQLVRAQKIGERSRAFNFDWSQPQEILEKVREELGELTEALQSKTRSAVFDELGDLLFSTVQLARHLEFSSEEALSRACDKFIGRFAKVEEILTTQNPQKAQGDWLKIPRDELEKLWQQAKRLKSEASR
jgi:MazG family protein